MRSREFSPVVDPGFFTLLIEDVLTVVARLEDHDSALHRREVIRAIFAAIEGSVFRLKYGLDAWSRLEPTHLDPADVAILREEQYFVDERGRAQVRPLYVSLPANVRFLVRLTQRLPGVEYKVDYEHPGWSNLQTSLKLRHRLTHPKLVADLEVSKDEVDKAMSGFIWLLSLCLEIYEVSNKAYKAQVQEFADAIRTIQEKRSAPH